MRGSSIDPATGRRRKGHDPAKRRAITARHQAKKRALVYAAKDHPCADCGVRYPPWVMDLDHVRGKKAFSIGQKMQQTSVAALENKIAKCEAVCSNCHRERTMSRLAGGDAGARESVRVY